MFELPSTTRCLVHGSAIVHVEETVRDLVEEKRAWNLSDQTQIVAAGLLGIAL